MQKYTPGDIKPFEFSELESSNSVSSTKFQPFSFKNIDGKPITSEGVTEETLRSERTFERKNDFRIDETVRELRGISRQEQNDTETHIQQEVERRLKEAYQKAYKEGLEKGRGEGQAQALKQFEQIAAQKIQELGQVVDQVNRQAESLVARNHQEMIDFIKRFTKWIVLKEINEKTYLTGLLEKLVMELNARRNVIIKVGKQNFSDMPEIVAAVEAKLGQLTNVRVEIVPEINYPGIILESENGLIDGSLEGVFRNIDKIFEQVLVHE